MAVVVLVGAFGFASCGDDDDDNGTSVTQTEIEKYLIGHDWNKMWQVDFNETMTFDFYFGDTKDEYTGMNGNYHLRSKQDGYVIDHRDFMFTVQGNTITIDVDLTEGYDGSDKHTYTFTVLSITSKTAKVKGILPTSDKEGTYTLINVASE